jgi:hypothetical protein
LHFPANIALAVQRSRLLASLGLYASGLPTPTRGSNEQCCWATAPMISLEDCIGLCGLTEEEVLAVAEHEHLPEIAATALAQYLLSQQHGSEKVRDMIVDDIRQAQQGGDKQHVLTLLHVLHHFLKTHPEAEPAQHPWSKLSFM